MAWAFAYSAGPAGSLETLTDYCRSVRVLRQWSTGRRGTNPVVQYAHGEYATPRKYVRGANLVLETVFLDLLDEGVADIQRTAGDAARARANQQVNAILLFHEIRPCL